MKPPPQASYTSITKPPKETQEAGGPHPETKTRQGGSRRRTRGRPRGKGEHHQRGVVVRGWLGWPGAYSSFWALHMFKTKGRQREDVCEAGLLEPALLSSSPHPLGSSALQPVPAQHAWRQTASSPVSAISRWLAAQLPAGPHTSRKHAHISAELLPERAASRPRFPALAAFKRSHTSSFLLLISTVKK